MGKKEAVILTFVLFLLIDIGVASAAADVAYIYKKTFKVDQNVISTLRDAGLTVELVKESQLPINQSNYRMLFVGDERFSNPVRIPVNDFPSIIANYYHADIWGLTDREGVSQLASNHPLSVIKNGRMIQVYTRVNGLSGPSISYYFLDMENKAPSLQTVALTETTSSGSNFGDVIATAKPGDRLSNGRIQNSKACFFGIIKSNFWTRAAKDMFLECAGFVISSCESNNECPAPVLTGEPFCQNGDVYQTQISHMCQAAGIGASCVAGQAPVLIQACEFGCANGQCVVPECIVNSDCGENGFIGEPMCSAVGNNVVRNFRTFTCNEPGTANSFCSSAVEEIVIQACAPGICSNAQCLEIRCRNDLECDDQNPLTLDECLNPGTPASECRNTPINCNANEDCGFTGFIGQEFCSANNVTKNFQTATCNNPGTLNSFCELSVASQQIRQCEFACLNGSCIRCDENLDCDDNDPETADLCHNPGTPQSFCTNERVGGGTIACRNNGECGAPILLSRPFCSVNNVNQLVMDWTCNNPGTTTSFCSTRIENRLLQSCPQFCSNGECVEIACFRHSDCDDQNPLTLDVCNEPGTPQSFCTNNPVNIICSRNRDCGLNGQIGGNVCIGNEVTQLFVEYMCNAPSTPESFCSSTLTQNTVQTCAFACSNGQCVPAPAVCGNGILESGEECDDGNLLNGDGCSSTCTIERECTPGQVRDCGITNVGECEFGMQTCTSNNEWGSCIGAVNPIPEVCDNLDNDCDGEIDEGGVCAPVPCTSECTNGARRCANPDGYQVCRDFNGDGCFEWSGVTSCGFGRQCANGFCG